MTTTAAGIRRWSMHADFNGIGWDEPDCVRASFEPHSDMRVLVGVGDAVVCRDGEGNSCEGHVARLNPGRNDTYATCDVRLDMSTWRTEETV